MKVKDSLVLSRIPEYLVDAKENHEESGELLESLNPTTVNVTASLVEKVLEGLDKFNTWTEFEDYSKEFKLDELFAELGDNFSLKQAELLKGFFKFKGTATDLKYILNTSGFDLDIYDADYFLKNTFIDILNRSKYEGAFYKLLNSGYTENDFTSILSNLFIKYVDNRDPNYLISNYDDLVVNQEQYISPELYFSKLGYSADNIEMELIGDAISSWLSSRYLDYNEYDCFINTDIYVDLDSSSFEGVRVTRLRTLITNILNNRLSVCALLKGIELYLRLLDRVDLEFHDYMKLESHRRLTSIYTDYEELSRISLSKEFTSINQVKLLYVDNNTPYIVNGIIKVPGVKLGIESLVNAYYYSKKLLDIINRPEIITNISISRELLTKTNGSKLHVDNNTPHIVYNSDPLPVPGHSWLVDDFNSNLFTRTNIDELNVVGLKVDNNTPYIVNGIIRVPGKGLTITDYDELSFELKTSQILDIYPPEDLDRTEILIGPTSEIEISSLMDEVTGLELVKTNIDELNIISDKVDNNNPLNYHNYKVSGRSLDIDDSRTSISSTRTVVDQIDSGKDEISFEFINSSSDKVHRTKLLVDNNIPYIASGDIKAPGIDLLIYHSSKIELIKDFDDDVFINTIYVDNSTAFKVGSIQVNIPGTRKDINDNFSIERKLSGTDTWIIVN